MSARWEGASRPELSQHRREGDPLPVSVFAVLLAALRDLGVGLPARAEPSDTAVTAALDLHDEAVADGYPNDGHDWDRMRDALAAAYAVDGAK